MTAFRRWMIMAAIMTSTTLYAMTILIVSVVLPQMQGSLSATPDQITWVMTFNILATAVVTPMSGWLAGRFGWRNVMLVSQAGFCISTFLCGVAGSLEALVFFRILQGGFGAPTIPLAQAIILDIFPRRQHSLVTSIFGMGVVVGPIFGPVLGGYLTELYNWRYAFYMLVPLALIGFVSLWVFLSDGGRQAKLRFDWTGFMLLAAALSCLQLVLDRGQRLDWLDSPEIILEIVIGCCALYAFLIHSFMADRPFLDLRLLRDNNYSLGLLIVLIYGMLNFTPMVVMPPMLKDLGGYPEAIIGTLLGTRGAGAILGFFLAGRLSRFRSRGRHDSRIFATGFFGGSHDDLRHECWYCRRHGRKFHAGYLGRSHLGTACRCHLCDFGASKLGRDDSGLPSAAERWQQHFYLDQRDDGDPHRNVELRADDRIRFAIQRDSEFSAVFERVGHRDDNRLGADCRGGEQSGRYDRLPECV